MTMDLNPATDSIVLVHEAPLRDVDGLAVRRALPSARRRLVGPFIFFDHMGPAVLPMGQGLDVRPHPHIGLATLTFLFEGEITHRDSLAFVQAIRPGDVNWMIAGSGIVHSERSSPEQRELGVRLHGIQCWLALPLEHEETQPNFYHHEASTIPRVKLDGVALDVVAGSAYGMMSPVRVLSPTLYVHALLDRGATLPIDAEHEERAIYVVEGKLECEGRAFEAGALIVLGSGADVTVRATDATRLMLLGGAHLSGERHVWWNLVSSSRERLERAKEDWKQQRMGQVPGETEFIPLPV